MNFLTLPNQSLSSNILDGGFFAQADLPAPLAGAFVGFDGATDSLINVALSSVFNTAPESDEFCLDLNREDFEIGDRFDIAVRVFDEDGSLQNFGSTDLTIFVDEFLNDGTVLFGITTRELSHGRVNPSEVARLENEAVDAYLNGETDEVPACLVEEAPEAPAVNVDLAGPSDISYTLNAPAFLAEVLNFEESLIEEDYESDDETLWSAINLADNLLGSIRRFGAQKVHNRAKAPMYHRETETVFTLPARLVPSDLKVGQIWTLGFGMFFKYDEEQAQTDLVLELRHSSEDEVSFELRTSEAPVLNGWTGRDVWIERAEVDGLI